MVASNGNGTADLREERNRLRLQIQVDQLRRAQKLYAVGAKPTAADVKRLVDHKLLTPAQASTLREAGATSSPTFDALDWVQPWSEMLDQFRFDPSFFTPITSTSDRRYGKMFPIFQNEAQLNLLRAPARIMWATNSYAQGALSGIGSYVIHTGYKYRVLLKGTNQKNPDEVRSSNKDPLVMKCQDIIDAFCERETWPELEFENFERSYVDGEFLNRIGYDSDGLSWVRTVEPEQVFQPPAEADPDQWSFGMRNKTDPHIDVQSIEEYFVAYVDNPANGDYVPANEMIHYKRNVTRSIKRGLPDLTFGTYDALHIADKLNRNMGEGAAVQAAIAQILQFDTASKASIEALSELQADWVTVDPVTGNNTPQEKAYPGMKLKIPKGQTYVPPPVWQGEAAGLEAILHSCLRRGGKRWNAPEWMMTGSGADMAAYTASLTAEAPFARYVLQEQGRYGLRFRKTMLRVLANAAETRDLPADILDKVDVLAEPPSIEAHDQYQEAQANQIRVLGKWKSPQMCAADEGNDFEQVAADLEEFEDQFGLGDQLQLPGEEGDDGSEEANKNRGVPAAKAALSGAPQS